MFEKLASDIGSSLSNAAHTLLPELVDMGKQDVKDFVQSVRGKPALNQSFKLLHNLAGVEDTTDPTKKSWQDNTGAALNTVLNIATLVPGVGAVTGGAKAAKGTYTIGKGAIKIGSGSKTVAKNAVKEVGASLNPKSYSKRLVKGKLHISPEELSKSSKIVRAPTGLVKSSAQHISSQIWHEAPTRKLVNQSVKDARKAIASGKNTVKAGVQEIKAGIPDIKQGVKIAKNAAIPTIPGVAGNAIHEQIRYRRKKKKKR